MGDQDMGEEGIFWGDGGGGGGGWGGGGGGVGGGLVAVFFRGEADLRVGWRQFFEKL